MPEKTPGPVAAKVKAEARRQGISQTTLAEASGLTQAGVSRRFTGEVEITVGEAELFARTLGVSMSWLFGEEQQQSNSPALQNA